MRSPITNSGCVKSQCAETSTAASGRRWRQRTSVRGTPRELSPSSIRRACQPHAGRPLPTQPLIGTSGCRPSPTTVTPCSVLSVADERRPTHRYSRSLARRGWRGPAPWVGRAGDERRADWVGVVGGAGVVPRGARGGGEPHPADEQVPAVRGDQLLHHVRVVLVVPGAADAAGDHDCLV